LPMFTLFSVSEQVNKEHPGIRYAGTISNHEKKGPVCPGLFLSGE
jgi:hypothetical protein